MSIQVTIFDEFGAPMPPGLDVELIREDNVLATAKIGAEGQVSFDVEATGPLAVRIAKKRRPGEGALVGYVDFPMSGRDSSRPLVKWR